MYIMKRRLISLSVMPTAWVETTKTKRYSHSSDESDPHWSCSIPGLFFHDLYHLR